MPRSRSRKLSTSEPSAFGEDHGELVAADACGRVTAAYRATQRVAEQPQHVVADGVARAVVDGLEPFRSARTSVNAQP